MKYYTGIGSRKTPKDVLSTMQGLAKVLGNQGYCLRSGNAEGADTAFYEGHSVYSQEYEIYLPWSNFGDIRNPKFIPLEHIEPELVEQAEKLAALIHPAWDYLKQGAKKLHTRNVFQVLGQDLQTPSEVVICWTENGETKGGTATAIRLAKDNGIPVWNLGWPERKEPEEVDLFD